MATRGHEPPPPSKTPTTLQKWNQLLSQAIRQAEAKNDPRTQAFKKAMIQGTAEGTLRRYSILSEVDLKREFPE